MAKEIRPEGIVLTIDEAKKRCQDCMALTMRNGQLVCDEANCPIQDVKECKEWEK